MSSGRPSKNFRNGSNPHIGASRSQSGSQQFGSQPKPQRGNGGGSGGGFGGSTFANRGKSPTIGEILFGKRGGKKKRRK